MIAMSKIREDLKDLRYYYARKEKFDEATKYTGENAIVKKAEKYNCAVKMASPKLYDLYVSLYIKSHTQESLSDELCYSQEYVQYLHKKLLKFLQENLKEEEI